MAKSSYVKGKTENSHCPECYKNVTLLCHQQNQTRHSQFFICFDCKKIFEVGKGEVSEEKNREVDAH